MPRPQLTQVNGYSESTYLRAANLPYITLPPAAAVSRCDCRVAAVLHSEAHGPETLCDGGLSNSSGDDGSGRYRFRLIKSRASWKAFGSLSSCLRECSASLSRLDAGRRAQGNLDFEAVSAYVQCYLHTKQSHDG